MSWASLRHWFSTFTDGERDEEGTEVVRKERLRQAYQNVFDTKSEDVQLILKDFATFTGFFDVNGPQLSSEHRAYSDGRRSAYGRLLAQINMPVPVRNELVQSLHEDGHAPW